MDTTEQMQQPQLVMQQPQLVMQQPKTPRKPKRGRPKSINMSADHSASKTVNKTVNKPINDSTDKSTDTATDKSTDKTLNQSTNKATDKPNSLNKSKTMHKEKIRVVNRRLNFKQVALNKPVKQQGTVVQFAVPLTYQIVSIAIPKSV